MRVCAGWPPAAGRISAPPVDTWQNSRRARAVLRAARDHSLEPVAHGNPSFCPSTSSIFGTPSLLALLRLRTKFGVTPSPRPAAAPPCGARDRRGGRSCSPCYWLRRTPLSTSVGHVPASKWIQGSRHGKWAVGSGGGTRTARRRQVREPGSTSSACRHAARACAPLSSPPSPRTQPLITRSPAADSTARRRRHGVGHGVQHSNADRPQYPRPVRQRISELPRGRGRRRVGGGRCEPHRAQFGGAHARESPGQLLVAVGEARVAVGGAAGEQGADSGSTHSPPGPPITAREWQRMRRMLSPPANNRVVATSAGPQPTTPDPRPTPDRAPSPPPPPPTATATATHRSYP